MSRVNHWRTKLLSYVGRVQLIKSVTFSIANYWMQCFPIPKLVVHKIEDVDLSYGQVVLKSVEKTLLPGIMFADLGIMEDWKLLTLKSGTKLLC